MSDIETIHWAADDPRRLGLHWRNDCGVLAMTFVSQTAFPPPGCTPGQAELEEAVRQELAAEREAVAAYAGWRAKVTTAEKEEASIKLQIERADLERRELLLAPASTPDLAARLGDNATEKAATTRMLERVAAGHKELKTQAEIARQQAERALRRVIDKCSTRLMTQAQNDIEKAAQEAAAAASAALTRLGAALMALRYNSSMGDTLVLRLRHLLDEVPATAAAPAELPTPPPPRDETPAPPATATVALPGGNPTTVPLAVQTGEHGVAQVTVPEAPPPAPVVPQPVADTPPAMEQGAVSPALPSVETTLFTETTKADAPTKPSRRRQRVE